MRQNSYVDLCTTILGWTYDTLCVTLCNNRTMHSIVMIDANVCNRKHFHQTYIITYVLYKN